MCVCVTCSLSDSLFIYWVWTLSTGCISPCWLSDEPYQGADGEKWKKKTKKKKHPSLNSHNPQMYCTVRLSWNLLVLLGWVSVWSPGLLWSKTSSVCISYRQRLHSPVDLNLQSINSCMSSVNDSLVIDTHKEAGPSMNYIWIDTSTAFNLNRCLNLYVTFDMFDFSKEGLSCIVRLHTTGQSWPSARFGLAVYVVLFTVR